MKEFLIDVPVLLIFFARPKETSLVFNEIKKARPSKLYLYQDGPRDNRKDDIANIKKCRDIVEEIDWDCKIYRKYQLENFGCDPSEYISQKWMFETEKYGIVLEDDDVPSQSFFPFCKELLEKYMDDERINMICGMNNTDVSTHIDESYLFTQLGAIWGWASWKRVVDTWDGEYKWLEDKENQTKLKNAINNEDMYRRFLKTCMRHKETGKAHYESIYAASMFLNNRLNIVPKYNLITNVGVGLETTHSVSDLKLLPRRTRKLLFKERFEISFPLIHPIFMVRDHYFENKMTPSNIQRYTTQIEALLLKIMYGDFKGLMKYIKWKFS